MKLVKTLAPNVRGRDFVVGDLHGCFEQFEVFRAFIKFDRIKDRMFSVGDLVDRGPDSLACLTLLHEPWFHAVKGNHEELMQDYLLGGPTGNWWFPNGGNWWNKLSQEEKAIVNDLVENKVVRLPLMITVEGQFHVLHAELSYDEELTDAKLLKPGVFEGAALEMGLDGASVIWGRNLFRGVMAKDARENLEELRDDIMNTMFTRMFGPKLSQIYSGHSPTQMPTRIAGQTNIDTCAFATGSRPWCGLTFAEPATGKFWKVTDDVNPVDLVIV